MGGLKRDLPITYWTFLIGSLAIAGVPLLSGFFSKDEILWKSFSSGHTAVWFVAAVASLLTAIYMFRLVILTFHGERRTSESSHAGSGHGHAATDGHHASGGGHLHDAPAPMAFALIVLAVGSVLAGYIGVPAVLGGSNHIEHFLAPSFAPPGFDATASHGGGGADASLTDAGHAVAGEGGHGDDHAAELGLMALSSGAAFAGIGLAVYFFLRNRALTDRMAARFSGLHRVLLHKYYVDELYDAVVVQPVRLFSERGLWRVVDAGIIDGAVNGVGTVVSGWSAIFRRLQTGSLRAYALSILVGAVVILGYFVWR
jgi:NADH-quinone oxidoreductase subunit L